MQLQRCSGAGQLVHGASPRPHVPRASLPQFARAGSKSVTITATMALDKSRSVTQQAPPTQVPDRLGLPRPTFQKPSEVVAMILGGGPGTDLYPLTRTRAEPAVPFAGLFRLIDVPVSNCVNSGITNIYVLAQYNATSLNRHLSRAYSFVNGITFAGHGAGFVETLNATQRPGVITTDAWYKGTADAVRRYMYLLQDAGKHPDCEDILILSGDQLYHMDFAELINYHRQNDSDVTIATTPADEDHATHLGILQVDSDLNVEGFSEKPQRTALATMSIDTAQWAMDGEDMTQKPFVASMGIYVFKKKVLIDLLTKQFTSAVDFSRDVLSLACGDIKIKAYPHKSYWEDVGSLKDYYAANIALAKGTLKFTLWEKDSPIYTEPRTLPPTKVMGSASSDPRDRVHVQDSLMGDGCRIGKGSHITGSVIGSCTYLGSYCSLKDTIVFGADDFDTLANRRVELADGLIPLGVGDGTRIERAIVDRNARVGRNVVLVNKEQVADGSNSSLPPGVVIRNGILVVMRDAVIPDGTVV